MRKTFLLFGLAAIALVGCTSNMVESYPADRPVSAGSAAAKTGAYGEYAVAKSVFLFTVSEAGGAGDKADDKKADAPSVSNTVNVTTTSAKIEDPKSKDKPTEAPAEGPADQAAWCKDLRKSYNKDRAAALAGWEAYNAFDSELVAWLANPPAKKDEKKTTAEYNKKIDAYLEKRAALDTAIVRASANLPLIRTYCPIRYKVEIKESLEPDSERTFRLYGARNDWSSDTFTAEFDGGFIKSVNATADHRGAEILVAAVKVLATVHGLTTNPVKAWQDTSAINPQAIERARKKPLFQGGIEALRAAIPTPDPPPRIDQDLPFTRALDLADLEGNRVILRAETNTPLPDGPGGIKRFDTDTTPLVVMTQCAAMGAKYTGGPKSGIMVAAQRTCTITIPSTSEYADLTTQATAADGKPIVNAKNEPVYKADTSREPLARISVAATDSRYVYALPVERTALVKRTTSYMFANGRVTKADLSRPSPIEQFALLPVKALGAVTSTIADGIRGRKGEIEARTEWTKAETANIEATVALQKAKDDARKPKDAEDGATP